MKLQAKKYSCGPTALSNALEPLGITRTEDELSALAGTTVDGTSEVGLKKALKALNVPFTPLSEKRFEIARLKLFECLYNQGTAILCVSDNTHWVSVVGLSAQRFIVIDSADNNLVLFWDVETLKDSWGPGTHYGLLLLGGRHVEE